ncbi:MAG: DUF5680 domain-containing protein [Promicromonosporaceae bacterium]|nr:DUF5680 domain-containing protein [Promicromonosporaceae bacterium]
MNNIEALADFLIAAKVQTYANAAAPKVASLRPGSLDYHWMDDDWAYHDTYFGGTKFIGTEVAYYRGVPVWGMNYYGTPIVDGVSEAAIDSALMPALMLVGRDPGLIPVRGPREFENNGWRYTFEADGDLTRFTGDEKISGPGGAVYHLHCHGGLIA